MNCWAKNYRSSIFSMALSAASSAESAFASCVSFSPVAVTPCTVTEADASVELLPSPIPSIVAVYVPGLAYVCVSDLVVHEDIPGAQNWLELPSPKFIRMPPKNDPYALAVKVTRRGALPEAGLPIK
jgi:hypothetical protein